MTHGLLLSAIFWLSVPKPLPMPPSGAIMVELIPEAEMPPRPADQAEMVSASGVEREAVAEPVEELVLPQPLPVQQQTDGMVAATNFYAASILNDPANSEVRENFPLLADQEQIIQICNIEALEQLRETEPEGVPDALVGYAFGAIEVSGLELVADGGAFRSHGTWRHIRYRCAAAPDIRSVAAFEYAVGELVPESEWEAHFLNGTDE